MACVLNDGRLTLSGDVGEYYWGDDSFSYGDVFSALSTHEDDAPLLVVLNSGGGIATEGAAIHAMLARRKGQTDVLVDGIAASAASLIAMAGQTVTMSPGSTMMIHDPAGSTFGDAAAHAKSIEALDALAAGYAALYAEKSGKTAAQCREIMRKETWLTADEAVAQGFADKTDGDAAPAVAAFPYQIYARAPGPLVAMAKAQHWNPKPVASASAQTTPQSETNMGDKTTADAKSATYDEVRAQLLAAQAKITELTVSARASDEANVRAELEALKAEKADRERTDTIMALDEAKGREDLAKALASGGMTVAAAKTALAAAPAASASEAPVYGAGLGIGSASASAPKKGDPAILAAAVATTNKRR